MVFKVGKNWFGEVKIRRIIMSIEKNFASPSVQYRGKPFWAWNGKLEEQELRHQVRILRKMGFAGGFMHSRVGLGTKYLSEEWFKMINACVDEAKKTGGEMWLYDEDRWPSGAAGGIVTKNPKYRQRRLTAYVLDRKDSRLLNKGIRTYYVRIKNGVIEDISAPLSKNIREKKGYKLLTFIPEIAECSSWYNGYTYLDTLSEDAVKQFIKVTFEAYKKHCGKEFGKTIPGIFTDEPNHGTVCAVLQSDQSTLKIGIPWTDKFAQIFRKTFGYEIKDHLPELFFDLKEQKEYTARYHYHLLKTKLFVGSFAKLIGDWCKKNSLLFTGHVLCERSLMSQTSVVGAAMRFYEYMQAPGIDILTAHNWEYETAKQCTSVANQMAKKWVLSELYGCTGWGFTFQEHKMVGDWQAAMGINLRCQHLSWYTMKQAAKRDYPASIFYQSPWWQEYSKVEDYFSRVNAITTQGKPIKNLLIIHPIESMWMKYRTNCGDSKDAQFLENSLPSIRTWLLENNIDFDYGDEEFIAKYAEVKKAKEPVFKVGKMEYKTVLVPPMVTIRKTTLRLLKKFTDAGGEVFFVEPVAEFVDGKQLSEPERFALHRTKGSARLLASLIGDKKIKFSKDAVLKVVSDSTKIISIKDKQGREIKTTNFMLREDESKYYLFVCNTGNKEYNTVSIHLPFTGYAQEWNPLTGKAYQADFKKDAKGITVNTRLYAYGSTIIVVKKNKQKNLPQLKPVGKPSKIIKLKKSSYPIILSEPNVVVLDMPDEYTISGKKYSYPEEILKIDDMARKSLGVAPRGGQMCQPWTRKKVINPKSIPVELIYKFNCDFIPGGLIELAVESPGRYTIFINKDELGIDSKSGWWVDKSIQKIPVNSQLLKKGKNKIIMKINYTEYDGLESIFLLGNFAVNLTDGIRPVIKKPILQLKKGNWIKQGFPFYSGSVIYHTDFNIPSVPKKAVLRLPDFKGVCFKVKVNMQDCGTALWPPYELDVTPALTSGKNSVLIELFSSRRNSFGPLHQTEPENIGTGPGEFVTTGKRWTQRYNLKPYGLFSEPVIEVYG